MSDLQKAFAGLKQAKEPERPGTQAPKRAGTEHVVNFVKAGQRAQSAVDEIIGPRLLSGTAKSQHPEYAAVKVFVRKRTHKAARRKWEDQGAGGDFSDLVERLLQMYLEATF